MATGSMNRASTLVRPDVRDHLKQRLMDFATVFAMPRDPEPAVLRASLLTWVFVAAIAAAAVAWSALTDFQIGGARIGALIALLAIVAVGCRIVRVRLRLQTPPALVEAFAQFPTASLFAVLLSYEIGSLGLPWADPGLAAADRALGFDWAALNRFVAGQPELAQILLLSYKSFTWQPAVVLVLLAFRMSHARLQMFLLAWAIGLAISLTGFVFAPSRNAYIFYGLTDPALPDLSRRVATTPYEVLDALRSGGLRNLVDQNLEGLVTFPSFHTAGALLYAWALWPVRWVRWPAIVLNSLVVASVPVIGAHYVVDVLGGVAVALVSLAAAHRLCRLPTPCALPSPLWGGVGGGGTPAGSDGGINPKGDRFAVPPSPALPHEGGGGHSGPFGR